MLKTCFGVSAGLEHILLVECSLFWHFVVHQHIPFPFSLIVVHSLFWKVIWSLILSALAVVTVFPQLFRVEWHGSFEVAFEAMFSNLSLQLTRFAHVSKGLYRTVQRVRLPEASIL